MRTNTLDQRTVQASIDHQEVEAMLSMLYEPGDNFALFTYPEKGKQYDGKSRKRTSEWFKASEGGLLESLAARLVHHNRTEQRAAALSVCSFDESRSRCEEHATAISCLAVDVDGKNLERVCRASVAPEEAVQAVLDLLGLRDLRPHMVVSSGHGLHLYFAIERFLLVDDATRHHVKTVWKKLGMSVGGSTDRFDFASVMRCWGTLNRKDGDFSVVRRLLEYCDLSRPRYRLEDMAKALQDVEVTMKVQQRARRGTVRHLRPIDYEKDPWLAFVVDTMAELDKNFAVARARSRGDVNVKDRSAADFAYARMLFECGCSDRIVEAELALSAKAQENGESYINSTVRAAGNESPQALSKGNNDAFQTFTHSPEAAYKVLRITPSGSSWATRSPSEPPQQAVVVGRPGSQKTRGITGFLSEHIHGEHGRVGAMTAFVGEALRSEYAINRLYPYGYLTTIDDTEVYFEPSLPSNRDVNLAAGEACNETGHCFKLPPDVSALVKNDLPVWTREAIRNHMDRQGLWINSWQPRDFDGRLEWFEREDGIFERPAWATSDNDPVLYQAHAVAKFRATSNYCLAGKSQRELNQRDVCLKCELKSCRANRSPGGARSYWRTASVALLTHGAYQVHNLLRPELNEFDCLICDEVPDFVYRIPTLEVQARPTASDRASWDVEPLDSLLRLVGSVAVTEEGDVMESHKKLQGMREKMTKVASKLRCEVMNGERTSFEYRVEALEPMLSTEGFEEFAKHVMKAAELDADAYEGSGKVLEWLGILKDFCGDRDVSVLAQQCFKRDGDGSLRFVRPVDGWEELRTGPDGSRRPLVLLDGTAGLDPRYLLAGGFKEEQLPVCEFPNTTLVLTSEKTVTKSALKQRSAMEIVADIAVQLRRNSVGKGSKVLVVTEKDREAEILEEIGKLRQSDHKALQAEVFMDHYGNLRGKNCYIECDAVFFTHVFRRPDEYYLGLELHLAKFEGYPKQWRSKNASPWKVSERKPEILSSSMVCDLYQDLMRINIRRDPTAPAKVFLPTCEPRLLIRLLRLMRGVKIVLPDGRIAMPTDVAKAAA